MDIYKPHQIGIDAELDACRYLLKKGYTLLDKNYSCKQGEIDLIMQDQDDIVFVEVRIRHNIAFGNALESITRSKMNKLIRAATHFLQEKKWLYKVNSRFDVIAIQPVKGEMRLEWLKNAFTVDR
jgi:putative endonuclease